ncbi:DNA polymerase I [Salipiger bermudensis]|uniref:DNA polymerase I n=1 Tax=Salipiger bermudensis (strain DSM 26914 / JCM 13377 / KCTC 12554 / HTCC2601) TaxID=314265 RepID=Q0FQL2_SALBH|nr:DNA polymerase I [Salipiger bermudensis]EAU46439.1 DNA polymerase I [Salipiger bermudensis HTCC2601]
MTQFGKGCHLHLIDGSAFIFRAYHALPPLTRKSDGLPIGAVSGFCNMLQKYVEDNAGPDAPTHVAVIFDKGSHTFRNDLYDLYKANREAMPEDLRPQIPLTRRATEAFNIACKELEGYEADDIIATLARQAREAGGRVTIISSDKDLMQLVGDGVEMLDAMKNRRIDRDGVFEKFGVFPDRVVDVQALAGDSVDNVPGAPGIGIKTAALLINEYGSLEDLLDRAEEIKQPKRRQTLIEKREQIELSKRLVQLDEETPLEFGLDDLEVRDPDPEVLLGFLAEMEFRSLTKRIADQLDAEAPVIPDTTPEGANPAEEGTPEMPAIEPDTYIWVKTAEDLAPFIDAAHQRGWVAVDTETTGLNEMACDLVGISLCTEPGEACYIPLAHRADSDGGLFGDGDLAEGQMPMQAALDLLKPLLEDPAVMKIGQNMKYDAKIFARYGVRIAPIDDTMLMSYAMNAGLHGHGMDALSERYLSHTPIPIKELLGSGKKMKTFDQVPIEDAVKYAAEDADITLRLWTLLKPQLHRNHVTRVYETMERPLVPVLAEMEMAGVQVDRDTLSRMSNAFSQKMAALEAEIHELAGESFNVGSPKQLGEILFDKMGLEGGKKGKTGAYATGADVLEDLATEHELPARVLDWRQLSKLKSTYTDALQEHINKDTGRVHTSYVISGANTGRLSSTDPNLQNIPVRSEEGRRIREAFVAPEGKTIVALDYSQIELRILAHMAEIDALKQAFRDGQDIHAMTASEMFNVPMDEMTSEIRRQAKAINFGVIYGISGFGLARNLRIPRSEAQGFIDRYFERFPGIRTYMDDTVAFAKEHKRVETLFGRVIHTPEIAAKGPRAGFAKRAAINAPIQGTAADIIRRAMIRMPDAIEKLPATMLLQVHDELIFEVEQGAEEALISAARTVMEGAAEPVVKLDVPLVVDAGQGKSWAEAH